MTLASRCLTTATLLATTADLIFDLRAGADVGVAVTLARDHAASAMTDLFSELLDAEKTVFGTARDMRMKLLAHLNRSFEVFVRGAMSLSEIGHLRRDLEDAAAEFAAADGAETEGTRG